MLSEIKICEGLSDLSDSYQGWIVDQWGVLHDGEKPYEGVLDTLKELKARGKQLIILSNSGKRSHLNIKRMEELGFDMSVFDHVVTSGEVTWQGLKEQKDHVFQGLGQNCLLFSRGNDRTILEDTGITVVESADNADFILLSGVDAPEKTLTYYEAQLKIAARRGLKMICANPDMKGIMGAQTTLGPGQIAKRYQDFGGVVHYIGKPHSLIYKVVMEKFVDVLPSGMIVVGDSLAHDILGGAHTSLDTCLIGAGLHRVAFNKDQTEEDFQKTLNTLGSNFGVRPTAFAKSFTWGKALPDRKNKKKKSKDS